MASAHRGRGVKYSLYVANQGATEHYWWIAFPVNTKHLYKICTMLDQRRRRWDDVVQMLYKCFVFAGFSSVPKTLIIHYKQRSASLLSRRFTEHSIKTALGL